MYTYIYPYSPRKIKYNRLTWWTKETKNFIYQNKTNYSNRKTKLKQGAKRDENKTNTYVGRKGKKEKHRYAKLNKGRLRRFIYIKD